MSSVETLSSQEVWVEAKEGYAMGDSSLEREGSAWQQPQKDMDIRREAFIRILTIIERGIGQRSRDKRREHRVSLALETLCYEHARNREEFCDPALFKVLLHRMAAEKAKRRRGRQCSESNYKPLDLSVIGMDSLIIPESAGPRDAFDPSRAMETEGFSFSKTGENERTGQNCSFSSQSQHQQQFASQHQAFRVGGKGGVKVKQEWAQPGNEIDAKQGLCAESAANQMARTSSVSTSSDISNEKTPDKPNRMDRISNLKLELDKDMIKAFDTRFEEHNSSNEFHGAELPLHMPFPGQQFSDLFDATQPMSFEGAHQGNQQQQQQQQYYQGQPFPQQQEAQQLHNQPNYMAHNQILPQPQPLPQPRGYAISQSLPDRMSFIVNPAPEIPNPVPMQQQQQQVFHDKSKPLLKSTVTLANSYSNSSASFSYTKSQNPRRPLSKDPIPAEYGDFDNAFKDLILYVGDILEGNNGTTYNVLDLVGQGSFGQVAKCEEVGHTGTKNVAVKIVKNKRAYYQQALVERQILLRLNDAEEARQASGLDRRVVELLDCFEFRNHFCLVFNLLSVNLYELLRRNKLHGLPLSFIKTCLHQITDALQVLVQTNIIHCDLKPENILLEADFNPRVQLIDFGSSCHRNETGNKYIQSRFYRAPEILLGLPYDFPIDMWSLGCLAVELYIGLPVFPGVSEHNQLFRITEVIGDVPDKILNTGEKTATFYVPYHNLPGKSWRLKTAREWALDKGLRGEEVTKRYIDEKSLDDIILKGCNRKSTKEQDTDEPGCSRESLLDLVKGLLCIDSTKRWTARQAISHPFLTGEEFCKPYVPLEDPLSTSLGDTTIDTEDSGSSEWGSAESDECADMLQQDRYMPGFGNPPAMSMSLSSSSTTSYGSMPTGQSRFFSSSLEQRPWYANIQKSPRNAIHPEPSPYATSKCSPPSRPDPPNPSFYQAYPLNYDSSGHQGM
mmetsp:Transcript_21286/g.39607  ORF Transcript_21286/g.39607 Transcript_21286/m.39607 type:complete len:956 (+) Transcript_21286:148-3015(+)